jgi:hypothetical protein
MTTTLNKPGAVMPDGSIYAGVSPDTGKPMYATPKDAPLTCTFNEAGNYASKLDAHGRQDWRVPTKAELSLLFENRAAIGGFNRSGSDPAGWYWSSSRNCYNFFVWVQRFGDRGQGIGTGHYQSSLRCVRG